MTGSFHISLFEGTLHAHALPFPVYWQTDFHTETFGRFAFTLLPLRDFVPERNSLPSTTTGMSPRGVTRAGMTFCGGIM